jgi:hypothetical protein
MGVAVAQTHVRRADGRANGAETGWASFIQAQRTAGRTAGAGEPAAHVYRPGGRPGSGAAIGRL